MKLIFKNLLVASAIAVGISLLPLNNAEGQTFKLLFSFPAQNLPSLTSADGSDPFAPVVASGTTLYGTTFSGGPTSNGTVFAIGASGAASSFKLLHSFSGYSGDAATNSDGASPMAGLVESAGTLFGTTSVGGTDGGGTIFAVSESASSATGAGFTNLYNFTNGTDGGTPLSGLVVSNGTLYGTTESGGQGGSGTVFSISTSGGALNALYSFTGANDGGTPTGTLALSGGVLYGTTSAGGSSGSGTVFAVSMDGSVFKTLYSFTAVDGNSHNTDGAYPRAGVIVAGGTLYGTALSGGPSGAGTVFAVKTDGTGFQTLHGFTVSVDTALKNDGFSPSGGLVLVNGTLYGTTVFGGNINGTVFSVSTSGTGFKTVYSFPKTTLDGYNPWAGLTFSGNTLYGTTRLGGALGSDSGTVYGISLGAATPPPPVKNYKVTAEASPVHAGSITGSGSNPSGTTVTLTATATNGCYQFENWTIAGKIVSTDSTYSFTPANNVTAIANFTPFEYTIDVTNSPPQGGKTTRGGLKACGSSVILTATPAKGFKFVNWVSDDVTVGTKPTLTIAVSANATFTANFASTEAPTVTITSPKSGTTTSSSVITVSGTAKGNLAVTNVYYRVGSEGAWLAANDTGSAFSTWSAQATLSPGANVVEVYAVDADGNSGAPISLQVTYEAPAGFAPASLSGYVVTIVRNNAAGTNQVSFGTSTFTQFPLDTNDTPAIANYTYTQTGPDTAELAFSVIAPPWAVGETNLVTVTFTDTSEGIYTNANGDSGLLTISEASDFAPDSISGTTVNLEPIQQMSVQHIFADGTFTSSESVAGTYTYTQYSPISALIVENSTSPSTVTSYILLSFLSANAGYFAEFSESGMAAGPVGTGGLFTVPSSTPPDDIAPASLDGMTMTIEPKGGVTYTASFGPATHGTSSFGNTDATIGVANYTYTRTDSTHATLNSTFISPPQSAGSPGVVSLTFSTKNKATFASAADTGTITLAPAEATAPLSLVGKTLSGTLANGKKGSFSFGDGTFTSKTTSGSAPASSGYYSYAVFGPGVGIAQVTYTDSADLGLTEYLQLSFTTAAVGTFYATHITASGTGTEPGTFTVSQTPH